MLKSLDNFLNHFTLEQDAFLVLAAFGALLICAAAIDMWVIDYDNSPILQSIFGRALLAKPGRCIAVAFIGVVCLVFGLWLAFTWPKSS